jgi:hypothetical protein
MPQKTFLLFARPQSQLDVASEPGASLEGQGLNTTHNPTAHAGHWLNKKWLELIKTRTVPHCALVGTI